MQKMEIGGRLIQRMGCLLCEEPRQHHRSSTSPLITHEFPLEQTGEAPCFADEPKDMAVKVMVVL
jgi:hypothetical protein